MSDQENATVENNTQLDDPRRVANRIRDAYTLTEAESILTAWNKATVIEELKTILNCWEYPALAPHFLTDRIAALQNEQDRNKETQG